MMTISFQPDLRPELPLVGGPKEYHDQRALFVRLDDLLAQSGLEGEFFSLSLAHRKIDLNLRSPAEVGALKRTSTLAFLSNLARLVTSLIRTACKYRTGEGKKHRKKVLREMKALLRHTRGRGIDSRWPSTIT